MDLFYLLPVGIALYFAADGLLRLAERMAGRLEHRDMIFFAILLLLALATFSILRWLLDG